MPNGLTVLILTILSVAICSPAVLGEESAPDDTDSVVDSVELDPIVVVAGKVPRPLSEVAAQVSVIDYSSMQTQMVEDLDGLFRYNPGLELETAGSRFGATSINVRGISGNRVGIEIDGVPARDQFSIGAYSNAGRALVEPDRIKRVEVLHGPASVMYGSNALGGVVSVTTWDPSDLTINSARPFWIGLRAGYQGSNESWVGSGVAAWQEGKNGILVALTLRDGHEMDNQAPSDIPPDPQDWDSRDFMFRYTRDFDNGHRLRFSAESLERNARTDINSQLGYGRRFRWTTSLLGDDKDDSQRVSLDYDFSAGRWQQGTVRVFNTSHDTDQRTLEERSLAPHPVKIERRFIYSQDQSGIDFSMFRQETWGSSQHRIGMGAEWIRSDISELRDGLQTSLLNGSSTNVILGEEMPVRDFPESGTDEFGVWIQDGISFYDGRLELIPALRWDRYDLDPRPDAIWQEDNPDTEVVSVSEDRVTPRLGVLYHFSRQWSLYGQYSEGFRAPPFEDANIGFDIPLFGFRAIPNPDLKSETSQGIEAGIRRFGQGSRFSVALFHADYDDFIESRVLIGFDPQTGDLIFQSRNIDAARIRGVDLSLEQDLSSWSDRLDGWRLNFAAYWADGENRQTDEALNSIAPPQAVLGLSWTSRSDAWEVSFFGTATAKKDRSDIDETETERFATPSWTTLDLTAAWRPADWLELRAGVFNLADETYWRWLDVARLEADNPMIPVLSRPGRNYSLTLRLSF